MAREEVILRFNKVSFGYEFKNPLLTEVDFSLRQGFKLTLMGQNGAGKSTLFKLITDKLTPDEGKIDKRAGLTIATSLQVIPRDELDLSVRDFFSKRFTEKVYEIDKLAKEILEVVNLKADLTAKVKTFSGGQQARLLLASALIQNPDLLLLDEPTNNLDKDGIAHLTQFLIDYKKTCIVISHDADFLNAFTDGVLYLDVFNKKLEQHVGDYFDVVERINQQIEKENRKNARLEKEIQENKDKMNFFANKGGKMRLVAKKMRDKAAAMEEEVVDVRKEDKTIKKFAIPAQEELVGEIISIKELSIMKEGRVIHKKVDIKLKKNQHLLLSGPNGIGKTTLLESIAKGNKTPGIKIQEDVVVGYYRQDFSTLDFNHTVYESLAEVAKNITDGGMRAVAAGFLINEELMKNKIGSISEGQKGLVSFARLILQKPGLLILDEPTNHINFRHLPIIAEALSKYQGAMILVSHSKTFVEKIRIDEELDLDN